MADDSLEGDSGLRFREDILRGVRLFAIVFAAILLCVAAYRMLRAPSDVQGAPPDAAPSDTAAQPSPEPSPDAAPSSEAASDVRPLVVPEPPPVGGKPVHAAHPRNYDDVPPPPPPAGVRAKHPQTPSGREFESSDTPVVFPAAPAEDASESKPLTPKQAVGYKSLVEVNANRPPPDPTAVPVPADEAAKPAKSNRFFRAIGKIFHPTDKKDDGPGPKQP